MLPLLFAIEIGSNRVSPLVAMSGFFVPLAVVLTGGFLLWTTWRRRERLAERLAERRFVLLFWVIWCVLVGSGLLAIKSMAYQIEQAAKLRTIRFTELGAQILQSLGHDGVPNDAPIEDPLVQTLFRQITLWHHAFPAIRAFYTVRQLPDGQFIFVVSPENDYDHDGIYGEEDSLENAVVPGTLYDVEPYARTLLERALCGETLFADKIAHDEWGDWFTIVVPMAPRRGEPIRSVLAGDIPVQAWRARQQQFLLWPRSGACFFWGFYVVAVWSFLARHRMADDLKRHHAEIRDGIARLEVAQVEAKKVAHTKSEFLAGLSHEIRTPITAVLGYAKVLVENRDSTSADGLAKHHEAITILRNNTEHILQIIHDIFDFSQVESRLLKLQITAFPIIPLMDEAMTLYASQATQRQLTLNVVGTTPFPETIETDRTRLKQVLLNLVSNAIKFTPHGAVTLSVAWKADPTGGLQSDLGILGVLEISVSDTGIGMDEATVASLFTAYQRAADASRRQISGTGLGLAISRGILQQLGGDIQVASQLGQGTTFTIRIPQRIRGDVVWVSQPLPRQKTPTSHRSGESPWPGGTITTTPIDTQLGTQPLLDRRILLVEDNIDCQRLFKLVLTKAGAHVTTANHGEEAMQQARASRNGEASPFDLILMDMQMPTMDGYTAVAALRSEGYTRPIAALTAHALPEEQSRCLEVGCNNFASKPILRDALITFVLANLPKANEETS